LRYDSSFYDLFRNRGDFEAVVFYDQNSSQLDWIAAFPLKIFAEAIYEKEFRILLKNMPRMLVGGWDAWVKFTDGDTKWCKISQENLGNRRASHNAQVPSTDHYPER
jgi:hypothetical protein